MPQQTILDPLVRHASLSTDALLDSLRTQLVQQIGYGILHDLPKSELIERAAELIVRFQDPLADNLARNFFGSFLAGAAEVAGRLPGGFASTDPAVTVTSGAPAEVSELRGLNPIIDRAVDTLLRRRVLVGDALAQAGDAERARAFTMAADITKAAATKVRDELARALSEGTTLQKFKRNLQDVLDKSNIGSGYIENVFRTGLARAYAGGQEDFVRSDPIIEVAFPYVENLGIPDSRQTNLCSAISSSGINKTAIYRADDPAWQKFKAPRHFGCRCVPNYLTVDQAAARGIGEAKTWLQTGRPPEKPHWVKLPRDVKPFEGWISE